MEKCQQVLKNSEENMGESSKKPSQPCLSKLKRMIVDLFECDRPLLESQNPTGQHIYDEDYSFSRKIPSQPIEFNEQNRHKFRPSAKHPWYSLAGLKEALLCIKPEIPDDETSNLHSQKASLVQITQDDLLIKDEQNEKGFGIQNQKQEIINPEPALKIKGSKDISHVQALMMRRLQGTMATHTQPIDEKPILQNQLDPTLVEVKDRAARKLLQDKKNSKLFYQDDHNIQSAVNTSNTLFNENINTIETKAEHPIIYFEDVVEDLSEYAYKDSPDRRQTAQKSETKEIPQMETLVADREPNEIQNIDLNAQKEYSKLESQSYPAETAVDIQVVPKQEPIAVSHQNLVYQDFEFAQNSEHQYSKLRPDSQNSIQPISCEEEPALIYKIEDPKPKAKGRKRKTLLLQTNIKEADDELEVVMQNNENPKNLVMFEEQGNPNPSFLFQQGNVIPIEQNNANGNPKHKRKSKVSKIAFLKEEVQLD